jgi:hypothetical protein
MCKFSRIRRVQNRISPGREHVSKKLFAAASVRNLIKEFEPASAIYEFAVVISRTLRKHRIVQIFRVFFDGTSESGTYFDVTLLLKRGIFMAESLSSS